MKNNVISFIVYLCIFLVSFVQPWDFDLGWHLRFGEDLLKYHTFSYTNTYSWELAGYEWFNSSWALDGLKYIIFSRFGFYGYALLGALVVTAIFFVFAKTFRLTLLEKTILFPLLLYIQYPQFTQSLKGQTVTFLFLALQFWILWSFQHGDRRKIFLTIPLFLLWTNLHAQFVLGLVVFAIWSCTYILLNLRKKWVSQAVPLGISWLLSFLITFLNPYGPKIYYDTLAHFGHPALSYIIEFQPPEVGNLNWWNLVFWTILCGIAVINLIRIKKFKTFLPYLIPAVCLLFLSYLSRRFIWPAYIVSFPVIISLVQSRPHPSRKIENIISYIVIGIALIYIVAFDWSKYQNEFSWEEYCIQAECSKNAGMALKRMKNVGHLFSHYNYGSWLIWNFKDIKPSVDGRMPLWLDEHDYSPFRRSTASGYLNSYQLEFYPYDTYFVPQESSIKKQLDSLTQRNKRWRKIYEDKTTSIYSRM